MHQHFVLGIHIPKLKKQKKKNQAIIQTFTVQAKNANVLGYLCFVLDF